jgi:hypothetical protein
MNCFYIGLVGQGGCGARKRDDCKEEGLSCLLKKAAEGPNRAQGEGSELLGPI